VSTVEALLQPVGPDGASGPDLEYDPEFLALVQLARGKPEQQFGEKLIPAQEPNWGEVRDAAASVLARSKDLRVAMLWLRGETHISGYDGFMSGLKLVHGLLDAFWDTVHPALEDDGDATMRVNSLAALNDASAVLRDVRRAVIGSRRGADALRVRDVELALGKAEPAKDETVPTEIGVRQAIEKLMGEDPTLAERLSGVEKTITAMEALVDERSGAGAGIDLAALRRLARTVAMAVPAAQTTDAGASESEAVPQGGGANYSGAIRSREDALRALDQVCDWLLRAEPTNPAPLVIQRARRLMTMSFIDIMRDVAPSGMDQVISLIGFDPSARN